MIRVSQLKLQPHKNEKIEVVHRRLVEKAEKLLNIRGGLKLVKIIKYSIDARKKDKVLCVYTVDFLCDKEAVILKKCKNSNVRQVTDIKYNPVIATDSDKGVHDDKKIVVVGAGPCGLFAAYQLVINGFTPILIDRGKCVENRKQDVERFWKDGTLAVASNVQFGEGGAGTFSDGKLNTQVKDSSGRIAYVLETFVRFGADEEITYHYRPHVGTDVLENIVRGMRNAIIDGGGVVRYEQQVTDIRVENNKAVGVILDNEEFVATDAIILAIGHSARDTFRMLKSKSLSMKAKDFAVGYRVMHDQEVINKSQYGDMFMDMFPPAPYKVAGIANGRGVYSFCMCPGGYVVNASSENNRLCVNGMSYSDRASGNANSAIIMQVGTDDYKNELSIEGISFADDDPLLGVYFQEILEERAYRCANGKIPMQLLKDFKANVKSSSLGKIVPKVKGLSELSNLRGILPLHLEAAFVEGMDGFGKSISGFADDDVIMCAIESRTSSPVRIERSEDGLGSIDCIYPAGEGAGYAGGITSAAVDGIITAERVIRRLLK